METRAADPLAALPQPAASASTAASAQHRREGTNTNIEEVYRLLLDGTPAKGAYNSCMDSTKLTSNNNNTGGDDDDNTATQDDDDDAAGGVFFGSVANLCSATLGAGVLALPYALFQAGLVVGMLLLAASAVATAASIGLIVKASAHYKQNTYESLVEHTVGRTMRTVTEICIVLFCGGCAVGYVIAVGDILQQSHLMVRDSRAWSMITVWCLVMLPLSLLRRMQTLQFASALGIASIGTLVCAALVHLVNDVSQETPPNDDSGPTLSNLQDFLWPSHGVISVLKACPIVLFAFSCQCNVCAIFEELPDNCVGNVVDSNGRDKEDFMGRVTWTAVAICGFLYASISTVALADLGFSIAPNILSSYEIVGIMRVACAAMAAAVIMAFPLNIFPARVTLEGILDRYHPIDTALPSESLTAALLEESDILEGHAVQSPVAVDTTCVNIHVPLATERSDATVSSDMEEDGWHKVRHVLLSVILSGMALMLALVVPDISIVFGFLGGTTSSMLGFVLPGMLGLRLSRDTGEPSLRPVSWTLLLGGIFFGVLTTGVTISQYGK
jgi:amino acid permease